MTSACGIVASVRDSTFDGNKAGQFGGGLSTGGFTDCPDDVLELSGVHVYNAACAAALLGDGAACSQALAELRARSIAGDSFAASLLVDMAEDMLHGDDRPRSPCRADRRGFLAGSSTAQNYFETRDV